MYFSKQIKVMALAGDSRGSFSGKIGFILAAAGSAVGLGNIWRFPYIAGQNGGAAFVLIYILSIVLIALPLLMNEIGFGRYTRRNPVDAFGVVKPGTLWRLVGYISILACFVVLSYYAVIAGWTLYYFWETLIGKEIVFAEFASDPLKAGIPFVIFMIATILIVQGGVQGGIERASRIMMPILFVLLVLVLIRSVTLPGAEGGLEFFLSPDFEEITPKTFLLALGQAFFSMSVGWGLMVTYGSYLPKNISIPNSSSWIAVMDTGVALLGGLVVFPAVFAFGLSPSAGPSLTFETLPEVFKQMDMGNIVGAAFFFLLSLAALTSSISMLEVPVSFLVDRKVMKRGVAAWVVGLAALIVGIPSLLSYGGYEAFTKLIKQQKEIIVQQEVVVRLDDFVHGESYIVEGEPETGEWIVKDHALLKPKVILIDPETKETIGRIELVPGDIVVVRDGEIVEAGLPVAFRETYMSFFDIVDLYFGTMAIIVFALLLTIFVGWIWNPLKLVEEISIPAKWFTEPVWFGMKPSTLWLVVIRFLAPLAIILMLIFQIGE